MRIMEMVSGAGVNGAIVHCLELSRRLALRNHHITLVCRPGAWIGKQDLAANIEVVESDQYPFSLADVRQLADLVRSRQIQLVHTHQSRASFMGVVLRAKTGVTSIATAHARLFQLHWMWNDHVIAASQATRDYHRWYNGVRPSRIDVIHYFVDTQRFRPADAAARAIARQTLELDPSQPVVGMIGHAIKRKGVAHLVEALPQVLAKHPTAKVVVVGKQDRDYMQAVMARADQLGVRTALQLEGQRTDVEHMLPAFDLFALPSLEEQMPVAILEAMASGLPIISTLVGGIPECVRHDVDGLLVPPAKPAPLAEAINQLLDDPARRLAMGQAARQRIETSFSPENNTRQVEALFEQVLLRRQAEAA